MPKINTNTKTPSKSNLKSAKPVAKSPPKAAKAKPVAKKTAAKKAAARPVAKKSAKKAAAKKASSPSGPGPGPQPAPPAPERPTVTMKCRRGNDKITEGQSCKGMKAYNESPDKTIARFRCTTCNYAWTVPVGGQFVFGP